MSIGAPICLAANSEKIASSTDFWYIATDIDMVWSDRPYSPFCDVNDSSICVCRARKFLKANGEIDLMLDYPAPGTTYNGKCIIEWGGQPRTSYEMEYLNFPDGRY